MRTLGRCLGRVTFWWVVTSFLITALLPYPAWASPMVAITQPPNGATIAAEIWIDAVYQSSSNVPIVRLELLVDDAVAHKYVLPTPRTQGQQSFSYKFDTETDQLHKVAVRALDSAGAVGEASIQVTVKKAAGPPGQDRTPPLVNVYYPHNGQQLQGTCEIKIDARDNTGVEWVFVYLDGNIKAMIKGNPPYVDRWDTTRADDGPHSIQARAWDAEENEGQSAPIEVTVANRQRTAMQPSGAAQPTSLPTTPGTAAPQPVQRDDVLLPAPAPVATPGQPAPIQPPAPTAAPTPAPQQAAAPQPQPVAPADEGTGTSAAGAAPAPERVAVAHPTPAARALMNLPPSTGRAHAWAAMAAGAEVPAGLPAGGFAAALAGQPQKVLLLREQFLGEPAVAARASVGSLRPSGESREVTPAAGPIRITYRIAQPTTGLVRTLTRPVLQAAPPEACVVPAAAALGLDPTLRAGNRATLPTSPPALSRSRPALSPATVRGAQTPPGALTMPASAATTTPDAQVRTTLVPRGPSVRPMAPGTLGQAEVGMAAGASEVYVLAMLPGAAPAPAGGARSSRPEVAGPTGAVALAPSALARFQDIQVLYDGKLVPLRACPEVTKGISVGPLREIFEQSDGVLYWFPVEKRVKAVSPDTQMDLRIGLPTVRVNGQATELELAPYIKQGRTMVPLGFLAATLNLTISFDSQRGQLIISRNDM